MSGKSDNQQSNPVPGGPDSANQKPGLYEGRRAIMETAVVQFVNQLRILYVVGIVMVVLGSIALSAAMIARTASLVPIGILMVVAAIFEMGIGNKAREEDGPATPWITSGGAHLFAGAVAMVAPLVHTMVFTSLLGAALVFAGLTWLRAGFALPPRFQSPIVVLCGGFTGLLGLLILSRWHGLNDNLLAVMLGFELLVRGWSWIGFAFGISKALKKG